jgi:hypothetical protein
MRAVTVQNNPAHRCPLRLPGGSMRRPPGSATAAEYKAEADFFDTLFQ